MPATLHRRFLLAFLIFFIACLQQSIAQNPEDERHLTVYEDDARRYDIRASPRYLPESPYANRPTYEAPTHRRALYGSGYAPAYTRSRFPSVNPYGVASSRRVPPSAPVEEAYEESRELAAVPQTETRPAESASTARNQNILKIHPTYRPSAPLGTQTANNTPSLYSETGNTSAIASPSNAASSVNQTEYAEEEYIASSAQDVLSAPENTGEIAERYNQMLPAAGTQTDSPPAPPITPPAAVIVKPVPVPVPLPVAAPAAEATLTLPKPVTAPKQDPALLALPSINAKPVASTPTYSPATPPDAVVIVQPVPVAVPTPVPVTAPALKQAPTLPLPSLADVKPAGAVSPSPVAPVATEQKNLPPLPALSALKGPVAKPADPASSPTAAVNAPATVAATVPAPADIKPVEPITTPSAATADIQKEAASIHKTKKKKRKQPSTRKSEDVLASSSPAFDRLVDENAQSLTDDPGLSNETRRILAHFPRGLDSRKGAASKTPFTIDRTDPRINELFSENYDPAQPVGINIQVKKPDVNINYELEKAYNALISGNQTDAIQMYKQVLVASPNNKLALFGLATTYQRAGRIELARPLYGTLLSIDPTNREALNNFLALVAQESPREALAQLKRLQTENPDFSPLPAQEALIYQNLGNYSTAITRMQHALKLSPENISYRYNLAVLYDSNNQPAQAAVLYQDVLDAAARGEMIPGNQQDIQERLTFLRSN